MIESNYQTAKELESTRGRVTPMRPVALATNRCHLPMLFAMRF